jgi:hypothetical protein
MDANLRKFRNQITVIRSIGAELFLGVAGLTEVWERRFRDDPVGSFLRLGDAQQEAAWRIVEAKMSAPPARLVAPSRPRKVSP